LDENSLIIQENYLKAFEITPESNTLNIYADFLVEVGQYEDAKKFYEVHFN
jgi:Tfp pilus assembly protein PilF